MATSTTRLLMGASFLALTVRLFAGPTLIGPRPNTDKEMVPECLNQTGTVVLFNCTSRAFYNPDLVDMNSGFLPGAFNGKAPANTNSFKSSFDDWNRTHGNQWTLQNGGELDITFRLDAFNAVATSGTTGGMEIQIVILEYTRATNGPTLDQLAWTQGLYVNYKPPNLSDAKNPYNSLDTYSFSGGGTPNGRGEFSKPCAPLPASSSNSTPVDIPEEPSRPYCDPIYPFQSTQKYLGDNPMGFYSIPASFRAIALLSTVTFQKDPSGNVTNRILTVYNGVSYGFDLSYVPEPSLGGLLAMSLLGLWAWRRRLHLSRKL
ncbi:MAG: PEP-CTERM sorting domain-containing protein [Bryobacterales bacterium]|nr:PEP-CTERM sorting domain-containing protein [Bryobacterales bacterium]